MKLRTLAFLVGAIVARGADLQPLITTTGKTLVAEDFSAAEIPATFRTLESAASFSIVEGALEAVSRAGQERSTHGAFMVKAHDLTIAFSVKFIAPGSLFIGVDGYKEEFKGNTHLVRFSLTPERMAWDEHRGGPESKHAVGEAMKAARKAKQPVPNATAEQLADPSFFHIEDLTSREIVCAAGEWHDVLLEVSGNELVAQVDGEKLRATATVADAMKNRIGLGLTGRGPVLIDRVRISENARRADGEKALPSLRADDALASFAYILQADSFAKTKAAAVERLAACGRDWMVLDAVFSSGEPWARADLDAICAGQPGRKVVAYISIGEAEDYRPYWRTEWGTRKNLTRAAPVWLGAENPAWKGNYRVKYWRPEWQALILATVDDAMACGFDGVYLDIVDGFETFEQEGREFIDDRVNPESKQTYRRDMVDWVKAVAARARKTQPAALVIPQNGSQLLAHADFLEAISAMGIEDLFTEGDKLQPRSHTSEVLDHLQKMSAVRKPVLLIEYPKSDARKESARIQAKANALTLLITDRQLKTMGESGPLESTKHRP